MTLQEKVHQLRLEATTAIILAAFWEKQIKAHGEHKAEAFYLHLGLNHIDRKGYEWEGMALSREPTEAEKRCVKGIAGAQETAKDKLISLLSELRTELISDGLSGIAKLLPSTYHTLILGSSADFRSRLRDRLIKVHKQGRMLVAAELGKKQDEEDEDEFEDLDTLTDLTTGRVANDVQSRVSAAAQRFALLGLAGTALLSAIQTEIQAGTVSYIDRAGAGLANKVINIGRTDEMRERSDEIARYEYSALLDVNTCSPCAEDDGKEADDIDDLPDTPNPDCQGSDFCRCFKVAILEGVQ